MLPRILILMQAESTPEVRPKVSQEDLLWQFIWTWTGFSVLAILFVLIVWWFLTGWTRRRIAGTSVSRGRRRAIKDAWVEAGKRASTPPPDALSPPSDEETPP